MIRFDYYNELNQKKQNFDYIFSWTNQLDEDLIGKPSC